MMMKTKTKTLLLPDYIVNPVCLDGGTSSSLQRWIDKKYPENKIQVDKMLKQQKITQGNIVFMMDSETCIVNFPVKIKSELDFDPDLIKIGFKALVQYFCLNEEADNDPNKNICLIPSFLKYELDQNNLELCPMRWVTIEIYSKCITTKSEKIQPYTLRNQEPQRRYSKLG